MPSLADRDAVKVFDLQLTADGWLLFATYAVRLFAYGFMSVVLGLYLADLGLEKWAIGVVFTAALAGGGVMTGLLTFVADHFGRRRVLVRGADGCGRRRVCPEQQLPAAARGRRGGDRQPLRRRGGAVSLHRA